MKSLKRVSDTLGTLGDRGLMVETFLTRRNCLPPFPPEQQFTKLDRKSVV